VIPPRWLGPERSPGLWRATDILALLVAALAGALAALLPWDAPRPPPAPVPVTRTEVGASLAGHLALVALMSWPLVRDLAGSGFTHTEDGRLNAWILAWDARALARDPARVFDAPIFHPVRDALAFSENLLLPSVLVAPAHVAGGPVLAFNLVVLASLVLSGLGVQLLVRRASGARLAAFVAGALFAVGAHRWSRLSHIHAHVTLFLPFLFLALDRFWERRTLKRGLLVGVVLALQALSSIYLGAIAATALAAVLAVALVGGLGRGDLARLAAGLLLAAALLWPVARPYLRVRAQHGMEWSLQDAAAHSTTLEAWSSSTSHLYWGLTQRHVDPDRRRRGLFPGLVPLALGLAGLAAAPRRHGVAALAAVCFALSLGPETAAYRFLHEHVVFFRGIRAMYRFAVVPVLALCVLAGFGLARRLWPSLLAVALALLEASHAPIHVTPYAPPSEAARWLAERDGAVAYAPLGERDTEAMLDGIVHFRPLVNGYSGFTPRSYGWAQAALARPDSEEALRYLRGAGVTHVVAREDLSLPLVARFGEERIYGVPPGEAAREVAPGLAVATLWSDEGIQIDLGRVETVGRVAFELEEADWIERPAVAVSEDGVTWTPVEASASVADAALSVARDPRNARGEVRFAPQKARHLRLDPLLPARPGALEVGP
jgi:hypothetical protein